MEDAPPDAFEVVLDHVKTTAPNLHQAVVACCSCTSQELKQMVRQYDRHWQGTFTLRGFKPHELEQLLAPDEAVRRIGTAVVTGEQQGLAGVIGQLCRCTGLHTISIESFEHNLGGACLKPLSGLQHLSSLSVELHGFPTPVPSLFLCIAKCSNLRSLTIVAHYSNRVTTGGFLDGSGDRYKAVTQLQQLEQLTLSGPDLMLPPAMVAGFTALQNLRSLTLYGDGHKPPDPALTTAFTGLTGLSQLTALHLVHGGPWDPAGNQDHYLARGPSPLVHCLAGFTQLRSLSLMVKAANLDQLAPLTNLQSLQLIVVVPDEGDDEEDEENDEDVYTRLKEPLSQLSGLQKLDTLWVEAVHYYGASSEPFSLSKWGLEGLPPALTALTNLKSVGLPSPRTAALPTTTSTVEHLVLSDAAISVEPAALAAHPGLRSLKVHNVTDITQTASAPSAGPAATASLLTCLVLHATVDAARVEDGRLFHTDSLPAFSFQKLPGTLRTLNLTNVELLDEPCPDPFKLSRLDKLWLTYDGVLPPGPYSSLLYTELGLYPLTDLAYTVWVDKSGEEQPQSVQIWTVDPYTLELVRSQEKQVCKWLGANPYHDAAYGDEVILAADKCLRAYQDGMLPDSQMDSILEDEAAGGRIPGMGVSSVLFPWLVHLRLRNPDNSNVALLFTKVQPAIQNTRTWYRSYALGMQPPLLEAVTAAFEAFLPHPSLPQAQQLLVQVAQAYIGPALQKDKYKVQVECTGLGIGGCQIDMTFYRRTRQLTGEPWEWAVEGLEQQPLATLGLLLRMLPKADGRMQPAAYRFTCASGQLVQRTICVATAALVCLLGKWLAVPGRVVQVQGAWGARLELVQRLYDAGADPEHEVYPLPNLNTELSRGQSSYLASEMRMAACLGEG